MKQIEEIDIAEYRYDLPDERIAKYPLEQRDASKFLVYEKGQIAEKGFVDVVDVLPADTFLVFNNTKVIHARLHFSLPTGRKLEILCLEPLSPIDYQQNLSSTTAVSWKCMIGGNRKWKTGEITLGVETSRGIVQLKAVRGERMDGPFEILFSWDNPDISFAELLADAGIIPLPPYLNRGSEESDGDRYQTVYAQPQGSVAAPTAGLHFTPSIQKQLADKGVQQNYVTLHVGAGTFKPVKTDRLGEHEMHQERLFVDASLVQALATALEQGKKVMAVGTTSLRTLESLYWLGLRVYHNSDADLSEAVGQWEPYQQKQSLPTAAEVIKALAAAMTDRKLDYLEAATQLLIAPGYKSQMIQGLITNFHQPGSTLLLLVAALIGEDWRKVYQYAMDNDFRFLSYGDSSLLLLD